MRLLAPAKINLHLRIGPPRADGFHPLLSWMTTVGLCDTLTFTDRLDGQIRMTCDAPGLACDDRNLVIRAAKLLQSNPTLGTLIHLQKKIPHGGGLGGGSSDAAFTLLGLNRLWDLNQPLDELDQIAAKLGSDINFFLRGPSSICRSRGEIVRPIAAPMLARWVVLILPAMSMPTPSVFRRFDQLKLGSAAEVDAEPDWAEWAKLPSQQLLPLLVNDLEIPAFALEPVLGELRLSIEKDLDRTVRMSGSGSSLFTLYDSRDEAETAVKLVIAQRRCRAMAVELCPAISPPSISEIPSDGSASAGRSSAPGT